ncbi:MAG: hypothetical protein LQ343_006086 [Gyalolechia ehrenbergii]|nr:MAG: hypothetical protein LQ343_006086 [Gyalolechia ehrenbergii]
MPPEHRILLLDAYDSFSHNIIALLEEVCQVKTVKLHIDTFVPDFQRYLAQFSAVVCGPGPGHPASLRDVGLFKQIWTLPDDRLLPALGICLGFQSLCYELGASVVPLPQPRHGVRTSVTSTSTSIFDGVPHADTVQYHSLHTDLGHVQPLPLPSNAQLWEPSKACPMLEPLAWDMSSQAHLDPSFEQNPKAVLMAVKHTSKPFYGIQFHPESICSDVSAKKIVANWWQLALTASPQTKSDSPVLERWIGSTRISVRDESVITDLASSLGSATPRAPDVPTLTIAKSMRKASNARVISADVPLGKLDIPSICDALGLAEHELIVLDSEE